jgi:hypothetical protein
MNFEKFNILDNDCDFENSSEVGDCVKPIDRIKLFVEGFTGSRSSIEYFHEFVIKDQV